ncbi:MAG: PLP-dependent transferase, partial [Chloroflexota bacterium]|nr:PLP-dependent transferase [Chloroflexota bacterium]
MTSNWQESAFETRAIHVGQDPDPTTGAVIPPIYQTSTYVQEAVGVHKGYEYSRTDNPTRTALHEVMAALEGGAWALAYASGLAATQNLAYLLNPGDHVLLSDDTYGGTYRLFAKVIGRYGIDFSLADLSDLDAVRAALRPNTRFVWVETPTNPYLKIVDIRAIAGIIVDHPARLVVDNTFASPYLQQPLSLGADYVLHSTTKYLGGHSDLLAGMLVTRQADETWARLKELRHDEGACLGSLEAYLLLRGMR